MRSANGSNPMGGIYFCGRGVVLADARILSGRVIEIRRLWRRSDLTQKSNRSEKSFSLVKNHYSCSLERKDHCSGLVLHNLDGRQPVPVCWGLQACLNRANNAYNVLKIEGIIRTMMNCWLQVAGLH